MLEDIENALETRWRLSFKPGSTGVMCCRGLVFHGSQKWPRLEHFNVLGHLIQDDGGIRADWQRVQCGMWASFWSNSGSSKCRSLDPVSNIKLLNRTVMSVFSWKIARWPFQKSVARELDALQCKLYTYMLPCSPRDGETLDQFYRRRLRQSRAIATQVGLWSLHWCDRTVQWNSHLSRGAKYNHICTRLLTHKNQEWLLQQRALFVNSQNSLVAGRTGSRLNNGKPQPRWSEGSDLACSILDLSRSGSGSSQNVSISTRIRDAVQSIRALPIISFFDNHNDSQSTDSATNLSDSLQTQLGIGRSPSSSI